MNNVGLISRREILTAAKWVREGPMKRMKNFQIYCTPFFKLISKILFQYTPSVPKIPLVK
jgi:hypothetical protein